MQQHKVESVQSVQWCVRVSRDIDRRARERYGNGRLGMLTCMAIAEFLGREEERDQRSTRPVSSKQSWSRTGCNVD
jgi:hypothetical protein